MISTILSIAHLVIAALLVIAILLQQKGTGIGGAFGGTTGVYTTRRGVDRILFNITIALSILFFAVALVNLIV
ncbi:MAG TPA: preprotein translocase subunit SecG [Candidatus Magasanikbacteria bacterium]|nr:preprotein translocase subunit SecG [Candidatus Magasanikbacteria bacterium]